MENSDDDSSYVIVDMKEMTDSDICMTESDQENTSAENKSQADSDMFMTDSDQENSYTGSESLIDADIEIPNAGPEFSDLYCNDVVSDMFKLQLDEEPIQTPYRIFRYPPRRRIKDVVKGLILPFLPAKSLVRFKTVSKDWNDWISSPFLAHKQSYLFQNISGFFCQNSDFTPPYFATLNQSAYGIPCPALNFLPELVVLRSSCNGLLLCQGRGEDEVYYVCNPVNKEWKVLPRPNYYHGVEPAIVLAFEPSALNFSADFEVLCAFSVIGVPVVYIEVYSSKEKDWRCYEADYIELGSDETLKGGFYMQRMVYWETSLGKVLAFDRKTKICGVLPLPPAPNGVLTEMKGELCYIQAHNHNRDVYNIDIYGGMDMSLKYRIAVAFSSMGESLTQGSRGTTVRFSRLGERLTQECRVLNCFNGDIVILLVGEVAYSYHLRDQKVEIVGEGAIFGARYLPYVNSLVSFAP